MGNSSAKEKKMKLKKNELELVRTSWNQVKCSSDYKSYGTTLMVKIFLKNPQVKYIWKFAANLKTEEEIRNSPQVKSHGYNVMEAVNAFVNSLDKKESSQLLYDLGNRHVSYGAKIEHFPIIIDALVETLSEGLGDQFTDEVKIAWGKAIAYLKVHMSMGLENTD